MLSPHPAIPLDPRISVSGDAVYVERDPSVVEEAPLAEDVEPEDTPRDAEVVSLDSFRK